MSTAATSKPIDLDDALGALARTNLEQTNRWNVRWHSSALIYGQHHDRPVTWKVWRGTGPRGRLLWLFARRGRHGQVVARLATDHYWYEAWTTPPGTEESA